MKKRDFQVKEQNQKFDIVRAVKIKDKDQVLKVVLELNSRKGLFTISSKIGYDKITDDQTLDKAMLDQLSALTYEAVKKGLDWKKEWNEAQSEPNRASLFEKKEEKKTNAKAAAKRRVSKRPSKAAMKIVERMKKK